MKLNKIIENNKSIILVLLIILALMYLGNNESRSLPMYGNDFQRTMELNPMSKMATTSYNVDFKEGYSSGEKIIKTSTLNLDVEKNDYEKVKKEVDEILVNGLYTNKNEYILNFGNKEYKNYRITIKVPVGNYSKTIYKLKSLGEVKLFSENNDDITTQYKDIEAYLNSYKKEKLKIEELLDRATDIEDIIKIENKLSQLQRTIDNYQKQLININRQTEYGTIYFSIKEKVPASQIVLQWTGIMDHLRNVVNGFDSVLVFISTNLGWALFVLLILFFISS